LPGLNELRDYRCRVCNSKDWPAKRDIKVRRLAQMPANRKNPGVHHTARQSRDREGALANSVAGMRSPAQRAPRRGSDWGFTAVHFYVALDRPIL
jgi:hypothetical protein